MSRVANKPVELPQGVTATVAAGSVTLKGTKGSLTLALASGLSVAHEKQTLTVAINPANDTLRPTAGATRAHLANMAVGVSKGYERRLELVGVGYRAAIQGKSLNLTLGFSHPVVFVVPDGIATPTPTEIVVRGMDRQKVGQVAAEIRGYRPPEPYKGKGVRYAGEKIELKEAKKK
jgi:large subunit ribosomal protein L6